MDKITEFLVRCNHTDLSLSCTDVIMAFRLKAQVQVILYIDGKKGPERFIPNSAILSGVPNLMAVAVAKELVWEYKDKETEAANTATLSQMSDKS